MKTLFNFSIRKKIKILYNKFSCMINGFGGSGKKLSHSEYFESVVIYWSEDRLRGATLACYLRVWIDFGMQSTLYITIYVSWIYFDMRSRWLESLRHG